MAGSSNWVTPSKLSLALSLGSQSTLVDHMRTKHAEHIAKEREVKLIAIAKAKEAKRDKGKLKYKNKKIEMLRKRKEDDAKKRRAADNKPSDL